LARQITDAGGQWFHVYNRGVGRQAIFRQAADRSAFLDCFARHLGTTPAFDERGRAFRWLRPEVAVGAYCLMVNHFHLLVWAESEAALSRLMRSATIGYGKYFNARYDRQGPLWQGSFKAKALLSPESILRATAYVHLNQEDDPMFRWSSHRFLIGAPSPEWLASAELLEARGGKTAYERYISAELVTRSRQRSEREDHRDSWLDLS